MTEKLLQLFKRVELAFPPPRGCHYALYYCPLGEGERGRQDLLLIYIYTGRLWAPLQLEERLLNMDLVELKRLIDPLKF